ncbi:pentatricopeptide repeat-containing protein, chloroplastic [Tanacetum coccineum]|uniref:Pentatricopeptide repeat-containing protein, chloroplastic n=1 Tax=Tanacetum coccineum TaxID=301880 RepID=A0ABQ5ITB1_9ASTR
MEVRTLVSWNAMIASYEQNKAGGDAIQLFREMLIENIDFDSITMVSVISACAGLGALIDMYSKCGSIKLATIVFNSLHHRSVVSYTSIIAAYASHGLGKEAIMLFSKMREEGIRPNSHCTSMVDLLGRDGKLLEAYEFIENMPIEPDADVWGALLSACRIHGNIELAQRVAHRLYRLNPRNVSFYVIVINIYAEAGRWEDVTRMRKLLDEMEVIRICGQSLVR